MPPSPWIGLDEECRGARRDRLRERVGVAVGNGQQAGWKRPESVPVLRLGRQAGHRDRPTVEIAVAADDLGAALGDALDPVAPLARRLDRRLDRFGPAVRRQRAVEARQLRKALEQERKLIVVIGARRHAELLRLRDQRRHDARVRVPEADRRIRAHQVQVAVAVDVGEPAPLAAREHDRQRVVVAGAEGLLATDQVEGGIGKRLGRGITTHARATKVVVSSVCHRKLLSSEPAAPGGRSGLTSCAGGGTPGFVALASL